MRFVPFGPSASLKAGPYLALLVVAGLIVSGCRTVGPDYARPTVAAPVAYSAPASRASIPDAWWTLFGDPTLDRLVDEALVANPDLAAAAARVDQARALLGLADAERLPTVDGAANAGRARLSRSTSALPPGIGAEFSRFHISATVNYELDFWGRYRRASEAARAELLATEEGRRTVRLGLAAAVATTYFDHAFLDRQLADARGTLTSRQESVRLQGLRLDAGTISEFEMAQAEAELAAAEAAIPVLDRERRRAENRLGLLLGRIGPVAGASELAAPTSAKVPEVPVGLPSDLLARRPDILAAEAGLVAANARIGVARAAFFPSISLTATAGSESRELGDLFSSAANIWQLGAGLLQPIWNAGRTRRQVEAATARQEEALALYLKSIQSAFAEVEDALAGRTASIDEVAALERQIAALERARELADIRYEAGESSYFEVLDADRNLFRARLDLSTARRGQYVAAVDLFKALGGGWEGL